MITIVLDIFSETSVSKINAQLPENIFVTKQIDLICNLIN